MEGGHWHIGDVCIKTLNITRKSGRCSRAPLLFTERFGQWRGSFNFFNKTRALRVEKRVAGFNSIVHEELNRINFIYLSIHLANVFFLMHLLTLAKFTIVYSIGFNFSFVYKLKTYNIAKV